MKKEIEEYIKNFEKKYCKKVYVKIMEEMQFYIAEEFHQDYAIKYPDKIKKELILSGRIKVKK